jgi:putative NADH-flavin reductase
VRLIDTPLFPANYRGEALAQVQALEIFLASDQRVAWTVLSPPKDLEQGERTGRYRIGGDQVFADDKGDMRISVADYAVALVDELERFTVAY